MTSLPIRMLVLPCVSLVVLGLLLVWAGPLQADPPKPEEIAKAIKQLGDEKFALREEASKFLRKAGKAAEQALKEALNNDDPEIVRRAREILDEFKWGIYPDTPENIRALILKYRSTDVEGKRACVKDFLQLGGTGFEVLVKITQVEDNAEMKQEIQQLVAQEASRAAGPLLLKGQFDSLEALLELGLNSNSEMAKQHYAAFLLMRDRLDVKIPNLRAKAEKNDDKQAAEMLVFLYKAKGDLTNARWAAEKSGKEELLEPILYEQMDWKTLAERQAKIEVEDNIEVLGFRAAYYRLAGNKKAFDKTVKEIIQFATNKPEEDSVAWFAAEILCLNNMVKEAIDLLVLKKNYYQAFEFLAAQMKYREAFDLYEKAKNDNDKSLPFLESKRARVLYTLGDKEKGLEHFKKRMGEIKDAMEPLSYADVVETLHELGEKDLALEACLAILVKAPPDQPQQYLLNIVFPKQGAAADPWWFYLRHKYADDEPKTTMLRLRKLLTGQVPAKELARALDDAERAEFKLPQGVERGAWLEAMGDVARLGDVEEKYLALYEKAAEEQKSALPLIKAADALAEKKQWKKAAEYYAKAFDRDTNQPIAMFRRGWTLKQAGEEKEGQKYMDLAHHIPLGNEELRHGFAAALVERGHPDEARRERDLIIKITGMSSWHLDDTIREASEDAYARKDYLKAADLFERFMLPTMHSNTSFLRTEAYLVVPNFVHRTRARALVGAGKFDEGLKHVQTALAIMPGDIELAILVVPELEKKDRKKEADELYNGVLKLHEEVCKDHANSAYYHNSLAWLCACCRRDLDKALDHALKATKITPKHAGYLDTLAEVYFQKGEKDKAIELMKECIALEPKKPYFAKQLKRFEAGDRLADVPPADIDE